MQDPKKAETKPSSDEYSKLKGGSAAWARYAGIGFQILGPVLVGVLVGHWLDDKYSDGGSKWTVILSSLMIVVSLYATIKAFTRK